MTMSTMMKTKWKDAAAEIIDYIATDTGSETAMFHAINTYTPCCNGSPPHCSAVIQTACSRSEHPFLCPSPGVPCLSRVAMHRSLLLLGRILYLHVSQPPL